MDDVKIINNFVLQNDLDVFTKYIDDNWQDETKFRHRVGLANNSGIAARAIFPDERPATLFKDLEEIINKYSKNFIDSCKDLFLDERKIYFYGASITRLTKDIHLRIHTDTHEDFTDLLYSGVLYINDNYEGGEIAFIDELPESEEHIRVDHSKSVKMPFPLYDDSMGGMVYKPKSGDLVVFPSNKPHGGKVIIDGTRDAIVFWSTLSTEYAFEGFDSDRVVKKIRY